MTDKEMKRQEGDALLLIDLQNDFFPGGALPVPDADAVIPVLNRWIQRARENGAPVYASRDWHPLEHVSFEEKGGPWPRHCIQDAEGAMFHPDVKMPTDAVMVTKGVRFDQDQNSAFHETGLAAHLKQKGIRRLFIGGLALDVCVLASVVDARKNNFDTILIKNGTRAVTAEGGENALKEMENVGARLIERL